MSSSNNDNNNDNNNDTTTSSSQYQLLLEEAASLDIHQVPLELLDCARYGETDAVRAILSHHSGAAVVGCVDDKTGSTPLHQACANGHDQVVRLLVEAGAPTTATNAHGNTPLHWAVTNGHEECVRVLLTNSTSSSDIDVLQTNGFGKSALAEAFAKQNTVVLGLVLEHDSASEERLIGGNNTTTSSGEDGDEDDDGLVHEFDLKVGGEGQPPSPPYLSIRELPIARADQPFGDRPEDDTTGLGIWAASLVMARWMIASSLEHLQGKTVLELGAGCGIPGLTAAVYGHASSVILTDLHPPTVNNLKYNIALNEEEYTKKNTNTPSSTTQVVQALTLDWDDESTWPANKVDCLLGSDLIYDASLVPLLLKVIPKLLVPQGGTFLYVAPETGRDGLPEFIDQVGTLFVSTEIQPIPPEYSTQNPLKNQNQDECFLHFSELASTNWVSYRFTTLKTDLNHQS